jgi:hypothetical protein
MTEISPPRPLLIAADFAKLLRAEICPAAYAAVLRDNARGRIFAAQDHCDANGIMSAAFRAVVGRKIDSASDADCVEWAASWIAWGKEYADADA